MPEPPLIPRSATYGVVRAFLTVEGWTPVRVTQGKNECAPGREGVCERYPGAEFCDGGGRFARGILSRKGDRVVQIRTVGDDIDALTYDRQGYRSGC